MSDGEGGSSRGRSFTEKSFYLGEFRDRTLAIALAPGGSPDTAHIEQVLKELEANPTDVVLFSADRELLSRLVSPPLLTPGPRLPGGVWRGLL